MLYIIEDRVMAYAEIWDLVERARESGNQIEVCGEYKTIAQALDEFRQVIIGDENEVHIIANNAVYFAAAVILGVNFTWALDMY